MYRCYLILTNLITDIVSSFLEIRKQNVIWGSFSGNQMSGWSSRSTRDLLNITPGKDKGKSKKDRAQKAFRPQCKSDTCERKGWRKETGPGASNCRAPLSSLQHKDCLERSPTLGRNGQILVTGGPGYWLGAAGEQWSQCKCYSSSQRCRSWRFSGKGLSHRWMASSSLEGKSELCTAMATPGLRCEPKPKKDFAFSSGRNIMNIGNHC